MWDQIKKKKKPLVPSGGGNKGAGGDTETVKAPDINEVMAKADAALATAKKAEQAAARKRKEESAWNYCGC